ncbi:SbcC/MukB-like Walker B domain-containing protein [Luteolibacter sp. AS25]|uniref:SbcC/MukB-like Walker B domain-containing protein n=1 Tax=Luteolibacter sp. AS25 TaxID=3135776 RepID=UPI00398B0745
MSSRVHLSRIVAINWYGYRRFIDISGLSLITGANGSGKSVLLDLIQFVMLGESLSRFNKAAAGSGSGRSLRGYCLCDTNTQGADGQERYLRPSGVTLAALEFVWPLEDGEDEPRRETWGARIEFEGPTSKAKTLWFMIPGRMEKDDFLTEDLVPDAIAFMAEDEFRVHVKRDLEGEVFDRQGSYLEEMATRGHLGFDRPQMNKTLPNSMAFQPVESFEKFIREYLLEPGMPDVKAVRASVDAHRRAQDRLDKMKDQLERLKRIGENHEEYRKARQEARLHAHLRQALAHEWKLELLNAERETLEKLRIENTEQRADYEAAIQERNELDTQLAKVRLAAGNDIQTARLTEARSDQESISRDLDALRDIEKAARQFLYERTQNWKQWLRLAEDLDLQVPGNANEWMKQMQGSEENAALDAAAKMPRAYQALVNDGRDCLRPIEEKIKELEVRESRLQKDLDDLDHKGSAAATPLLDALKSRGQRAEALGRVIEVKEEAEQWWPLLENLLGKNRISVLPEDYTAAWDQAQRLGHTDEPLVNPDEVGAAQAAPKEGSVASFFETKHSLAANYLQQLYGDMMAVENNSELENHARAFSKDGWLKEPPHRIHIQPAREFTIGQEGLRRLRAMRRDELEEVSEELAMLNRTAENWRTFLHRGESWQLDKADPPAGSAKLRDLPRLRNELAKLNETIRLLATPEREAMVEDLRVKEKTLAGLHERVGRLGNSIEKFDLQEKQSMETLDNLEEDERDFYLKRQQSRETLAGVLDAEISGMISSVGSQFPKWQQRLDAVSAVASTREHDSDKARRERDIERHALAETHPEAADAFDPDEDENSRYDARRDELESHELEKYTLAAEDARKEWEDRLQHQVLDVLKEKLDEAERTKRELNRAMDHEIGGWRYQLSMKADRSHSAIWALVDKGLNPSMELFAEGAKEEIEKAKEELMLAIENADEPRHQRALDYRYYHHWDIQATPTGKGEGAAISLNKNAKKQSGGENQAPFFVAMLAAFQRVYSVDQREMRKNLGIVIMDEAFSKLSGDRIDACLALARNFGLQLIMAFPEDRLPTMIQHAKTVVQCRVDRTYDDNTGRITDINNWVVKVDSKKLLEVFS